MGYSGVQFAAARNQVSLRLADPLQVVWSDDEIGRYLVEALQCWSALTGYWRDTGLVTTTAASPYFDLSTLQNGSGVNPINLVSDTVQMLYMLQYHLLETKSNAGTWAGTEMFSYAQIQAAIQRRADQFIVDTGCNLQQSAVTVPAPPVYRFPLTAISNLVDLRRVAWKDATTGIVTPLLPGDEFEFNAFSSGWQQKPGFPQQYSILDVPVLTLQVTPPPAANGSLDVIYTATKQIAALPADDSIPIPADYGWAVKWGAMADLLNIESEAKDASRSAYCEQRYQQGVEACKMAATVMQAYYNGVQIPMQSMEELDRWNVGWQNATPGPPQGIAVDGLTQFAVNPPSDVAYQVQLDVVASAVIPVADTDYLQIGPEELDAIYGYAQHIAVFKRGGEDFAATMPLLENFIRMAAQQNARLTASSTFAEFLVDRQTRAEAFRPRISGVETEAKQ